MTPTNETDEMYRRRQEAARMLLDAPQGAQFQFYAGKEWVDCGDDEMLGFMYIGQPVRIKPTPKRVLRPAWEIFRWAQSEDMFDNIDGKIHYGNDQSISIRTLVGLQGKTTQQLIDIDFFNPNYFPDAWFTEKDTSDE